MKQPGIYESMPSSEYHADPALSRSVLREMRFSPAHCKYRRDHPIPDTPALMIGRAVHSWTLEPDQWEREWAVWENGRRAGNAWKEFVAANEGKNIIKAEEFAPIKAMSDAVHAHLIAGSIIENSKKEVSVFWDWEGQMCKCRPDIWDGDTLWDLKTTTDASLEGFKRAIWTYGYHHQAGYYCAGTDTPKFGIIAVEKSPPHGVGVYLLDPNYICHGLVEMETWLKQYRQCDDADLWPGYNEMVQTIDKPDWME